MPKKIIAENTKKVRKSKNLFGEAVKKSYNGFSPSLLKSATQKAIRRGDYKRALKSAKLHLRKKPNDFFRRLPMIVIEDVMLHPEFKRMVELSSFSAKKSYILNKKDELFALNIVEQLAKSRFRDMEFFDFTTEKKSLKIIPYVNWDELDKTEKDLLMAMKWREKMGGLKDDLEMLNASAKIWAHRFSKKVMPMSLLKKIFSEIKTKKNYSDITLKESEDDILLESIDFHMSPLVKIVLKKAYVTNLMHQVYPNDVVTTEERLIDIIWRLRSGINYKQDFFTGEKIDWFYRQLDNFPTVNLEKYEFISSRIKNDVDKISRWFIKKFS